MERARQDVEPRGVGCLAVCNAAALGLCALSCGDLAAAIDHLERAWDAAQAAGLGNPNVVPFAGDLAEALARAGAAERAEQVLAWLQDRADATGLVYPRAAAARARGILARDPAEAEAWFARARSAYQMTADAVRAGPYAALRGRGAAPRPPSRRVPPAPPPRPHHLQRPGCAAVGGPGDDRTGRHRRPGRRPERA